MAKYGKNVERPTNFRGTSMMKKIQLLLVIATLQGCSTMYTGESLGSRMLPDYYTANGNIYTYHKLP